MHRKGAFRSSGQATNTDRFDSILWPVSCGEGIAWANGWLASPAPDASKQSPRRGRFAGKWEEAIIPFTFHKHASRLRNWSIPSHLLLRCLWSDLIDSTTAAAFIMPLGSTAPQSGDTDALASAHRADHDGEAQLKSSEQLRRHTVSSHMLNGLPHENPCSVCGTGFSRRFDCPCKTCFSAPVLGLT
jgi:hypothetical protein